VANLKDIKRRISSVQKTKQITSAMKLVSGAKLARASQAATAAQPYQLQLSGVLRRVASAAGESFDSPLLRSRPVKRALIVVITSDRGLCGGFNNNLSKRAQAWIAQQRDAGVEVEVGVFGRKANDYFRNRRIPVEGAVLNYSKVPKMELVEKLGERARQGFLDGRYDSVFLAYNEFENTITQTPTITQLLPLSIAVPAGDEASNAAHKGGDSGPVLVEFEFEPGPTELLEALLPLYLRTLVLQAFLETEAGEHAARMTAMDNATRNAADIIGALTLEYNRARQAAITTEIIEIVSGAEALK
jgi:F-type H+-transporting ATPase subunit gamma